MSGAMIPMQNDIHALDAITARYGDRIHCRIERRELNGMWKNYDPCP